MYDFTKLTLGYVPTRRDTFPPPEPAYAQRDEVRAKIDELCQKVGGVDLVDIDWLNDEKMLVEFNYVAAVEKHFREKGVDALFLSHMNFGQEESMAKLAKALDVPVLLWGPRDPAPREDFENGPRQFDTQCGLFATSRALRRYGVMFTYIENCWLDDPVLERDFDRFIRTATIVKAMRNLRIGQFSVRPRQFLTVKVNESELLERFGIEVTPINEAELFNLVEDIRKNRPEKAQKMIADMKAKFSIKNMSEAQIENQALVTLAFQELSEKYELSAFASECWDVFQNRLDVRPCSVFGMSTDLGLPIACETDIHGAISSVITTAAKRGAEPNFLADVTVRHPSNDNAELFWHCGPFPASLAKPGADVTLNGCHGQYELKEGDVTLCRFDADRGDYFVFCGEAKTTDGPATDGNYVWLEFEDWVRWEKSLVYGPYIHHISGIYGNYAAAIEDACRYLGLIYDNPDEGCCCE